ncbi:hypothetical protein NUW58_g5395 [Xylaria curta]|uniref:Uncharacterized protein n=1 Tax=Xylaria curta TaxID=42375 RepID=A0ACC1P2I7_9PEZI|nr:hypothetical protein NUW58_g5395 [Xylaria curta]
MRNNASHTARGDDAPRQGGGDTSSRSDDSDTEDDSDTGDELYLNAIESACLGEKGAHTQSNILKILVKATNDPDERQKACLEAMRLVSKERNHRLFEELLEYVPIDAVTLGLACRCGSVKTVQAILRRSVSINATSEGSKTPLQVALDCGHSDLVEFLVANGATLETIPNMGSPPSVYHLVTAVLESGAFSITKCEELVRKLLRFTQQSQVTTEEDLEFIDRSLVAACRIGSTEVVSSLLELVAKPGSAAHLAIDISAHISPPLLVAIKRNQPGVLSLLLQWTTSGKRVNELAPLLDTGLKACLGKKSPIMLQSFLKHAGTIKISDQHLILAIQKCGAGRGIGESDLAIILKHRPDLTPSEEVLVTLFGIPLAGIPPWAPFKYGTRDLWRFALRRSDCGVTERMIRAVCDREGLEVLHKYCAQHQSGWRHTHVDRINREFQTAARRIHEEESKPHWLRQGSGIASRPRQE